jgi:hypothetical protein
MKIAARMLLGISSTRRTSVSRWAAITVLSCLAIGCGEEKHVAEKMITVTSTSATNTTESVVSEIEGFMVCRMPFHPTERLRKLINKKMIPPTPLNHVDGAPHFAPTQGVTFHGQTVLLVAAFDPNEWDDLYTSAPGTIGSPHTLVYVVGRKDKVESRVPSLERQWLSFQEDSNFWKWLPSLRKSGITEDSVTTVTCYMSKAKARGMKE